MMKKHGILNSEIAGVLAAMGHTDRICIGDCGLPVPEGVKRIDLAIKPGFPGIEVVLEEVLKDMVAEKVILADEIRTDNGLLAERLKCIFAKSETGFKTETVPHEEFKQLTKGCKAIIRTGEITPYANIILQSGCIFAWR